MKKVIAVVATLMLVCLFGYTAFAASKQITVPTGTVNVTVIDDFSSYTDADNFSSGGSENANVLYDGSKVTYQTDIGVFWGNGFTLSPSCANNSAISSLNTMLEESNYIGFHFKNNTDKVLKLAFEKGIGTGATDAWSLQLWGHETDKPILLDATGKKEAEVVSINDELGRGSAAAIPANFDGWVFYPFTALRGYSVTPYTKTLFTVGNFAIAGLCDAVEGGTFEIDNLALAANMDIVPTPPTADISVIAYAAAAILGCGALAVGKKRK